MRLDHFERICALCPEIEPAVVKKVIDSLAIGFQPREVAQILGFPGAGDAVKATRDASMFLVLHRFQPCELPVPPSAAPALIVDALSPEDQLELLYRLNEKRAELLREKVKTL